MLLKDGTEVEDPRTDRIYQLDWRSLNYAVDIPLQSLNNLLSNVPRTKVWTLDTPALDQGPDGACVGFTAAHDFIAEPQVIKTYNSLPVDATFAKEKLYWEFQKIDVWDGGSYPGAAPIMEGTSILALAQYLKSIGVYNAYYWGLNLRHLVLGTTYLGPWAAGIKWRQQMFTPDARGFIRPRGDVVGGHAFLVRGVVISLKSRGPIPVKKIWNFVNYDQSYFVCRNSWGPTWGKGGDFYMSLRDMESCLMDQGDACFPQRAAA